MNESRQNQLESAQPRINHGEEKLAWPPNVPVRITRKANQIYRIYGERYGSSFAPSAWETTAQSAAKLKVVAKDPKRYDPEGRLKLKYEAIIGAFDLEAGAFPSNFNPDTGTFEKS